MKHIRKLDLRWLGIFFLLIALTGCIKSNNKQLPPLELDSDVEYAMTFLHAMNSKDTKTIDALLDKEAIIVYENNPQSIPLGFTTDKDSYISYLLELNNRYENIEEETTNLSSTLLTFLHSNKLLEDIWQVEPTQNTRYEFVVENQRITLLYVYTNLEEQSYQEEFTQGGVGIEFSKAEDNSHLLISYVYAGTPAAVLKLAEGDLIYSLNGVSIAEMSTAFDEPESRILGAVGTPLVIEVQRVGKENRETLTMTRMALQDYIPLTDEEILNQIENEEEGV